MNKDVISFLQQAIDGSYKSLEIKHCQVDTEKEIYDLYLLHGETNREIHIGFRDSGKRRDFEIIPLQTKNAPLGLIQIYTTFLNVWWHSQENHITFEEALVDLAHDAMNEYDDAVLIDDPLVQ
jgi:hypothetical protein